MRRARDFLAKNRYLFYKRNMSNYTSMNDFFSATAYPLVSQFFGYLASLPGFSEEDNPWVAKYEAYGGECAPPGALTLRQHDLVHFLLGVNFVPYNTDDQRKDSERFLTGFQFGADPAFTDDHAQTFKKNVEATAPEDYKFGKRGEELFDLGVELGRRWHAARQPQKSLREFLQDGLDHNHALHRMYAVFWTPWNPDAPPADIIKNIADTTRRSFALNQIQETILEKLAQIRGGVPESVRPDLPWGHGRAAMSSVLVYTMAHSPDGTQKALLFGGPVPTL